MKKYFYLKNGQQIGPFTYDELWNQKISPNTMVWFEGMKDWQKAHSFPEFVNWFPKRAAVQRKRPQQTRKPQQPARQIQRRPAPKKSYRGIIGIGVFLVGVIAIFYFWTQGNTPSSTNSAQSKSAKQKVDFETPALQAAAQFTKENYPLHPQQIGERIADFLGSTRTSFSDAKLLYMHPDTEEKFQFITDTYSEFALKVFFQGPIPVIKYQSFTSALVLFYNPWNDLVLITDWQLVEGHLFIHDIELVTADLLAYDGLSIPDVDPLWARDPSILPIEALTNAMETRVNRFNKLWETQTGTGNWRQVLTSLLSPAILIDNQAIVALRLRNHYAGMQHFTKGDDFAKLRNPFVRDLKNLHAKENLATLLEQGPQTPDVVWENFAIYPPEIWKYASFQSLIKVPEGAFIFVTTPKLTKTFLSFYYKFDDKNDLILSRIDWCTFDNEL